MCYKVLLLLAVSLTVGDMAYATNYCDPELCGSSKHIACGNNGEFAAACNNNGALVPIDDSTRQLILDEHNAKRDFIAGGNDPKHDPACRMAKIQWDDELAKLAELNVKQCEMRHDSCHLTDSFKWSGQNLAWRGTTGQFNYRQSFIDSIQDWYNEVKDSNMNYINAYPSNPQGTIGHFTVMVADKNIRLGCAASTYQAAGSVWKSFLFACNYAYTNILGLPIYKGCATAATNCKTGTDATYRNLCSVNEPIDPNDVWG